MKYPELNKYKETTTQRELILKFLDFASSKGAELRNKVEYPSGRESYFLVRLYDLLNEFFGIDSKAIEQESKALGEELKRYSHE